MDIEKAKHSYLPMSETMYYILLSLNDEMHGYGIMQNVEKLTQGRIKLGAGTIYNSLSKLEKDSLIKPVSEYDRRKSYIITNIGSAVISAELKRLKELYENGKQYEED